MRTLAFLAILPGTLWAAPEAPLVVADTHASARLMALVVVLGACLMTFGLLAVVGAVAGDKRGRRPLE